MHTHNHTIKVSYTLLAFPELVTLISNKINTSEIKEYNPTILYFKTW